MSLFQLINHARFLQEALGSVCAQTYTNWEAIVINNDSEDNTVEVVESLNSPKIRLQNFRNNGVIAASRNRGIALTNGKYLTFLDSDDLWLPEKLACSVTLLEEGCDLVCHGLRLFGSGREQDRFYEPAHRATFEALLDKGNCVATSATVVKKDLVESVGGGSEESGIVTAEDYYLWLKLACVGAKMSFVGQVLGCCRLHLANASNAIRQAKAVMLPHLAHLTCVTQNCTSFLNPPRIKLRFRYRVISYGVGRCMQANNRFLDAWPYFLRSLACHPFYLKTYAALALNIFHINYDK